MIFHYFFAQGQSYAGTLTFNIVETLKNHEYFFSEGGIKSNAIIFYIDAMVLL